VCAGRPPGERQTGHILGWFLFHGAIAEAAAPLPIVCGLSQRMNRVQSKKHRLILEVPMITTETF
jgi:hypothetical protein